jgi:hypothetical protein
MLLFVLILEVVICGRRSGFEMINEDKSLHHCLVLLEVLYTIYGTIPCSALCPILPGGSVRICGI